jgi:hypothetical protein
VPVAGCSGTLVLVADDGKFLGNASSNMLAADGVCNEFSNYGGQFGADSIFNEFGMYGSQFGSLSAYDEFTSTPPFLFCPGANVRLNPVTKNNVLGGAIDPDVLCLVLEANGY